MRKQLMITNVNKNNFNEEKVANIDINNTF